MQWYVNVPGVVRVTCAVELGCMLPLSKAPAESDVAVCKPASLLMKRTVLFLPITTVIVSGVNPNWVFCPEEYPVGGDDAPDGIVTLTHADEGQTTPELVPVELDEAMLGATSN
jgi:hypothetical protein